MKNSFVAILLVVAIANAAYGEYKNGKVFLHLDDVVNGMTSDYVVYANLDDESPVLASYVNGVYELPYQLSPGFSKFNVQIRNRNGKASVNTDVTVVAKTQIEFKTFSLTVDRKTTDYNIPYDQDLPVKVGPKTTISMKVVSKDVNDFVPTTTLLLLEAPNGKKLTLPMVMNKGVLTVSFNPARKDVALPFNYENGVFQASLLCGDALLESQITLPLIRFDFDFGDVPEEPIYHIYSKPLLYESESSIKPLKEISHVFKSENKNPFFVFPLSFSIAIIFSLFVLIALWGKVGFVVKRDSSTKQVSRLLFCGCVTAIVVLYAIFWYGWNIFSLFKILVPLALVTVLIGSRAL